MRIYYETGEIKRQRRNNGRFSINDITANTIVPTLSKYACGVDRIRWTMRAANRRTNKQTVNHGCNTLRKSMNFLSFSTIRSKFVQPEFRDRGTCIISLRSLLYRDRDSDQADQTDQTRRRSDRNNGRISKRAISRRIFVLYARARAPKTRKNYFLHKTLAEPSDLSVIASSKRNCDRGLTITHTGIATWVLQRHVVNGHGKTVPAEPWERYPTLDELYTCYDSAVAAAGTLDRRSESEQIRKVDQKRLVPRVKGIEISISARSKIDLAVVWTSQRAAMSKRTHRASCVSHLGYLNFSASSREERVYGRFSAINETMKQLKRKSVNESPNVAEAGRIPFFDRVCKFTDYFCPDQSAKTPVKRNLITCLLLCARDCIRLKTRKKNGIVDEEKVSDRFPANRHSFEIDESGTRIVFKYDSSLVFTNNDHLYQSKHKFKENFRSILSDWHLSLSLSLPLFSPLQYT